MPTFKVVRGDFGRLQAKLAEGLVLAIQILPETDRRRMEKGVQAYAVLDIATALGPIRVRNIQIVHRPSAENAYQVHWLKHPLRRSSSRSREYEFLDVAGPLDHKTRRNFSELILSLYYFIKQEAQTGKVFPERSVREEAAT